MKITRYYPGFIEEPEEGAEVYEIKTPEEFVEHEYFSRWAAMHGFVRFASVQGKSELLVAVLAGEQKHILGFVDEGSLAEVDIINRESFLKDQNA